MSPPKPSLQSLVADAKAPSVVRWQALPPDMQVLLDDMAIDWYGVQRTPTEAPIPVSMTLVAPLYAECQHNQWDDRGPLHVARLAKRMRALLPDIAIRRRPEAVARALLAVQKDGLVAIPPIVTTHGHFADGRHRLFAARAVGITHLPVIELSTWLGCDEQDSIYIHPQAERLCLRQVLPSGG